MRLFSTAFAALVSVFFSLTSTARADANTTPSVLDEARTLALRCVVQKGHTHESTCPELHVKGREATLSLPSGKFQAVLIDSEDADGGDLDHLIFVHADGTFAAERINVLAFGDIFLGLSGGDDQFHAAQK